jgi:hypothetical protein
MGISSEMMVVMANKSLYRYLGPDQPIRLGGGINEFFQPGLEEKLTRGLAAPETCTISGTDISGRNFAMKLIPLTGRY